LTYSFDFERYKRQLEVFGSEGQEKISNSSVLVVGAGGLGSSAIAYLAAAGIGRLGIVDGDFVEKSNLQRQIIHAGKIGENKAESAAEFVERLNPDVVVDIYPYSINPKNVLSILEPYDVIVGCPDSFNVRFLLNDACAILSKPFVHGAVYKTEGEVGVFKSPPCYRCYLPKARDFLDRAILGVSTGVFGCFQAMETLKIITGYGEVLEGKILRGDLDTMKFFEIKIPKREDCPVCGKKLKGIYEENYLGDNEVVRYE